MPQARILLASVDKKNWPRTSTRCSQTQCISKPTSSIHPVLSFLRKNF